MLIFEVRIIPRLYQMLKLGESGCNELNSDPQKRLVQVLTLDNYKCDPI